MAANGKSLKIASRLVCTDQWLVTHVDPSWPILYLKQYLLHKFHNLADDDQNPRAIPVSPRKTRRRSLSPITFAPPTRKALVSHSSSEESNLSNFGGDVDLDDDVNVTKTLADAHRYKYNARPSTSSASDSAVRLLSQGGPDPQAYVLLTFSTTQILEDRFSLSWYGVHPNELLELHPVSLSFVSLQRSSLDAYITPYFATRVWALRVVGNRLETAPSFMRNNRPGEDESVPDPKSSGTRDKGKRKVAVEWKERWAIIHHGVFSLCKERHDTHVAFSAPLSSLLSIHDSAHLTLPLQARRLRQKSSSSSNVVCVKFSVSPDPRQRTFSNESHTVAFDVHHPHAPFAYSGSSSGQGAWWRRGSRDVSSALSLGLTSSASVLVGSGSVADVWDTFARKGSRLGPEDLECDAFAREKWKGKDREEREDAVWIVLDMLDSSACSHILRILHRHAPPTCRSTFLPSRSTPMSSPVPSPIIFSSRTSTPITPSSPITPGPSSSFIFPPPPVSPTTITPSPLSSPTPHTSGDPYAFPSDDKSPAYRPTIMLPKIDTSVSVQAAGVPYPSWRLSIVRNARRAGLGSVGRAMELVMFGDEDEDEFADIEDVGEEDNLVIQWARRTSSVDPSPIEPLRSAISTSRSRTQLRLPPRHFSDPSVLSCKSSAEEESALDPSSESQSNPHNTQISNPDPDPDTDPLPARDAHPLSQRQAHPLVDLTSLHDPEHDLYHDSDRSEVEWDGWVDAVVEQHKQESILAQACAQQAQPAKNVAPVRKVGARGSRSGSGGEFWAEGWSTRFGGSRAGTPSPAASMNTLDHDPRDEEGGNWSWPRGNDAEVDTEGSEAHSSDPNAPPTSSQRRTTSGTRGRKANPGNAQQGSGRTLSTYSSVDSLLRRTMTMRTNIQTIKSISLTQAKRASMHVFFPSASRSDANLSADVPQRAASASPPPVTHHLSRPSMASMRSAGSMGSWTRPLSPLSSQLGREDGYDEDDGAGDADADAEDVDNVEEDLEGDGTGYVESELGHDPNLSGRYHPIPLPGMRMVPAGYTTFQHSALYGMQESQREGEGERVHAGIVHGQSMQRLPMGMSSMMTTVSSTVSVGPSARRSRAR